MNDRHEHLDEGTIHAWLDGALSPDESAQVEERASACADCAALVAEARGLVAASSRILSSLDAVPAGVIPGVDAGSDQLAALRARRKATAPRWWRDRRIVAAASLVFVAGASSLVWRSSQNQSNALSPGPRVAESVTPVAPKVAAAEADARSAPSREAPARDAKVEAPAPLRDEAPARVAASRAADSVAERKVMATSAPLPTGTAVAANEARQADAGEFLRRRQSIDSTRADQARTQLPLQQGAASQRQSFEQLRVDSVRPAAPPSALGAGARLGSVVVTGAGASAPIAKAASPAGACYLLRLGSPSEREAAVLADTVRLLDDMVPVRSDPSWFRARRLRAPTDTSLVWRSIDSTTVELHMRSASESLVVRFSTTAASLSDLRADPGVTAVLAVKVGCR